MNRKRWFARLLAPLSLVLAATMLLSACGGDDDEPTATPTQPPAPTATIAPTATRAPTAVPTATPVPPTPTPSLKRGGILRLRLNNDPSALTQDSWNAAGGSSISWMMPLMSNFVVENPYKAGEIIGDIATSWTTSADGTTWTFKMRTDAKFNDGTAITPAVIVWNMTQGWKPPAPAITNTQTVWRNVTDIKAVDASTVQVTLKQPSASFLTGLGQASVLMYPQHILGDKRDFTEFVKKPVGSGPFIRTEATPGSAWKVRRYDGYHGKDARGQALPYLDGIDYTPIVDFSQTAAALRTGRIDLATAFDARIVVDILDELKGSLKYEFFSGPGVRFDIALRNKAPFDNKRVRQAISMGIDRKLILDSVEKGRGIWQPPPLVAPEQGGVWGLPRTELEKLPGFRQPHTADFNEAVRILRAEGVREGTPFNYIVFQTFVQSGETDVVLTELKKLGFNPTPVIFSSGPEIIARVSSGNFDGWRQAAAVNFDDPSQSITPFMATGAGRNYTNFSIPDLDRLLDEQDRTLDFAKRRDLMWQLQRAILDDASTIPIHYGETLFGWPPYVKNHPKWVFSFGPQWRYDTVWLDK